MDNPKAKLIKERLNDAEDLPTLPDIAIRVTELVNDENSNVADVVAIIRNDAALTSKILKVANSAFYGMRRRIESLNMALVILGMREINSLVTAISVFGAFPKQKGDSGFDVNQFWLHSASVGEIAKLLARRLGSREESSTFTAGLLHDIGKLVLFQTVMDDYLECLEVAKKENMENHEAERRVLGIDHMEIGATLLQNWGLPDSLCTVTAFHHTVADAPPSYAFETALTAMADRLCKEAGVGFGGMATPGKLTETDAWEVIAARKPTVNELDVNRFSADVKEEIGNARDFLATAYA